MIPSKTINIIDKGFDVDKISDYTLKLKLLKNSVQLSVVDESNNKCLAIEDNVISELNPSNLKSLIQGHSFASAGFWKKLDITFSDSSFALLPFEKYSEEDLKTLATSAFEISTTETLKSYNLDGDRLSVIFSVQNEILTTLDQLYPKVEKSFRHVIGELVNSIFTNEESPLLKRCFALVEGKEVSVIVTEGEKILFGNSFPFDEKQDLEFFILYVFKHHFLNQESSELKIYGDVTPGGDTYQGLNKFVKNLKLGSRPNKLKFSYQFDEIADHRLLDLIS